MGSTAKPTPRNAEDAAGTGGILQTPTARASAATTRKGRSPSGELAPREEDENDEKRDRGSEGGEG